MSTPNPPWEDPRGAQPQGYLSPPAYPAYPYPYPPPPTKTNWWAVTSFVLGLIGVVVLSVVFGLVALSQAKRGAGGRGLAIAGLVLSGLWVVPFVAIVVYGVTTGLTSDTDTVDADDIHVGDCLAEIPHEAEVAFVETIDCQKPHAGEVFAQLAMPDGDFPGEDAIVEMYGTKCEPELAGYSSTAAQDTSISLKYMHPTQETWERGDRTVHCIAVIEPPRTGSIKG
jgi:hypothetical protein